MEKKYCLGSINDDKVIDELAKKYGNGNEETSEFYRQILTTIGKLSKDLRDVGDIKIINSTLKELRYAFKIFSPYRNNRKVVIFGSHKISDRSSEYKMAEQFARMIAEKGWMVITGGGGGIMEAGNKGAGPGKSFAVNIKLPTEQIPNPYVRGERLVTLKYFFNRKLIFIKESDATVLFPGGFGTHDEAFEVLTLLQTGKNNPRPLVFVDTLFGTYWKSWLKFIKDGMMKKGLLYKDDLNLFKVVNSVRDAVNEIETFYRVYNSLRYVGDFTIIRLNKELSPAQIEKLNKRYKDILVSGKIEPCKPSPEETKTRDKVDLFRLTMKFDRMSYGRLTALIREINKL
jgi:uncharacterized protein (TIGR00730 family)